MSYEIARRWACRCYAKRVCGMAPPEIDPYDGTFDVDAVVEAAPVPSSSNLHDHVACWEEFRRLFKERWREHEEA